MSSLMPVTATATTTVMTATSEKPHATIMAHLSSMETDDTRLLREFQRTCSSIDISMKPLGQRFQELSQKNACLRAQLTGRVKHEREMAEKREVEIAILQQRSKVAKEALETLKLTVNQTTAVTKQKTLAATTKQAEAIKKVTQAGDEQIAAIKQQVAVVQQAVLSKQLTSFQERIWNIHQAFERLKTMCETEEAQFLADLQVANGVVDQEIAAFYKEQKRELHVYFKGNYDQTFQDIQRARDDKSQNLIQISRNMLRFLFVPLTLIHRRFETLVHRGDLNNTINLLEKIRER